MSRFNRLRLAILGVDPGLSVLRMSIYIVVSMAVVSATLVVIGRWFPMPTAAYVIGLLTTMQGAMQISDPSASARAFTRIYAAIAAFAAIAAISLVHDSLHRTNLVLLVIIFTSTYAARFGRRWRAVGFLAVMAAIIAAFVEAPESALPAIAIALAVSGLVAHIGRSIFMPDQPERDFRRVVGTTLSVSRELRSVIEAARSGPAAARSGKQLDLGSLRRVGNTLSNDIRASESYLPLEKPGQDTRDTGVALRLLDLQLAVETILAMVNAPANSPPDRARIDRALNDIEQAEQALQAAVATLPADFPPYGAGPPPPPLKPGLLPPRGEWLNDRVLRLSIQVTLASAIALVVGEAISSQRWFWAVMAAFLIFNNAQSAGAVAVRGLDRAWGTAIGIVIGIALATLTHQHIIWTGIFLAISVFATFFLGRVSYVGMTFFLTISLSLMYGLMGIFTPELLVLRLVETAVGVASGALVALFLLPTSTRQQVEAAMSGLLNALGDFLGTIVDRNDQDDKRLMAGKVSAIDKALGNVLTAVGPMRSNWAFGSVTTAGRDIVREAYVMAYAAHRLERRFRETPPREQEVEQIEALSKRLKAASSQSGPAPSAAAVHFDAADEAAMPDDAIGRSLGILSRILDVIEARKQGA